MTPVEIIETIAKRWSRYGPDLSELDLRALEVTFRDAKQSLGFEEPQSRTQKAVERTAPMAFVLYGMTVLWHAEHGEALREKWPKVRLISVRPALTGVVREAAVVQEEEGPELRRHAGDAEAGELGGSEFPRPRCTTGVGENYAETPSSASNMAIRCRVDGETQD